MIHVLAGNYSVLVYINVLKLKMSGYEKWALYHEVLWMIATKPHKPAMYPVTFYVCWQFTAFVVKDSLVDLATCCICLFINNF